MADPIYWKSKIFLAKLEATYGTDAAPGATDAIYATDVSLSPMEGTDVARDLELPYLGALGSVPVDLHRKLSFKVELTGSGTAGTAPAWGKLLRGCAVAETISAGTSVTYNPVSDGHESLTIHFLVGATRYRLLGARGTAKFVLNASGIPMIEFEFTGLYSAVSEESRPATDFSAWQRPTVVSSANTPTVTINAVSTVMRNFSLDLANSVEPRFLVGGESILITDRADMIEAQVEAVPVTTLDPYALAVAQAQVDVTVVHGTQAGHVATINAPAAQMMRPQGLTNAQNITEWPLRLQPVPQAGNDQWTLVLT